MLSSQLKMLEAEKDKLTGSLQESQEQLMECQEKLTQTTDPAALEYLQAQEVYCKTSIACDQKKLNKINASISQANAPKQEEEKSEEQNIKDIAQEKMDDIEEGKRKFQGKQMKIREKIYKLKSMPDKSVEFINREMAKLQVQFDEVSAMMTAWVEEQTQKVEEWIQEKITEVINKQIEKAQQKIEMEKKALEDQMKQALVIKTGIKL